MNTVTSLISFAAHKSTGPSLVLFFALPILVASCSPLGWEKDADGLLHKSAEGSWRALEATSAGDAWMAGSTGDWMHVLFDGKTTTVHRMRSSTGTKGDTATPLQFRGIAVTSDAVLATAIASPAHIQRSPIQENDQVDLHWQSVWVEEDSAAFMDAILALDDQTLVAMGDPLDSCLCVVRSDDGGHNWQRVPCSDADDRGVPKAMPGEAAFAASNGNLSTAGNTVWMLSGGGASRVYRSTDRGQNWTVFPTPLRQGGTMTGGFSMDFADENNGIIWGGNWEEKEDQNGRAAVTEDGGETWTLIAEGEGPGYASSVRYRPGSRGQQLALVGTPGGIDLSDDGGQTWRHFSDSAFYTARFSPDGEVLWLAGKGKIGRVQTQQLGW